MYTVTNRKEKCATEGVSVERLAYKVLSKSHANNRALQIIFFSLPKMSNRTRSRILTRILEESGAVALIELISPRGIVRKPMLDFNAALIFDEEQGE